MNLAGNLLIAPPAMKGNFWHKTVIMITEHHNKGSVGIVLNKRSNLSIVEFADQLGFSIDCPGFVYVGGPVNTKSLCLLHTSDWISKNTLGINEKFCLSSADDILPRLAMGDRPNFWRLFLGLSGWAPGQLVAEIKGSPPWNEQHSWCIASADEETIFGTDEKDQWCKALDRSGLEFAQNLLA